MILSNLCPWRNRLNGLHWWAFELGGLYGVRSFGTTVSGNIDAVLEGFLIANTGIIQNTIPEERVLTNIATGLSERGEKRRQKQESHGGRY
jgi:hypothetical protein